MRIIIDRFTLLKSDVNQANVRQKRSEIELIQFRRALCQANYIFPLSTVLQ